MIEPRLATHFLVASLVRRANASGDFATVLAKGDETAGAILIVGLQKGVNPRLFERYPARDGDLVWQAVSPQIIEKYNDLDDYLSKRRARDPDLWILELDVASDERFTGLLDLPA